LCGILDITLNLCYTDYIKYHEVKPMNKIICRAPCAVAGTLSAGMLLLIEAEADV